MKEFTRRELFQRFRKNTTKTALRTIRTLESTMKSKQGEGKNPEEEPLLGLLDCIKSPEIRRNPSLRGDVEVTDECSACEVCANVCPEGALKWSSCKEGKQLQFEPRLCDACGTCTNACRQKAITISNTAAFSHDRLISRENKTVITVSAFNCAHCSIKSFSNKEENICFVCKAQRIMKGGAKCSA